MNWEQLLNQQRNEAITSKTPPYILDYQIEGQTVTEFYTPHISKSVIEPIKRRAPRRKRIN